MAIVTHYFNKHSCIVRCGEHVALANYLSTYSWVLRCSEHMAIVTRNFSTYT